MNQHRHAWPTILLLAALPLSCDDAEPDPIDRRDTPEVRSCERALAWTGTANKVAFASELGGFAQVEAESNGATWTLPFEADPGEYAYEVWVDDVLQPVVPEVPTKWLDGVEYRNAIVDDCNKPTWRVESLGVEDGTIKARLRFVSAAGGAPIDPDSLVITAGEQTVSATIDEVGSVAIEHTPAATGKHSLRVRAADTAGVTTEIDPLWLPVWVEDEAFDWRGATLYLAFTDRFRDSDASGENVEPGVQPIAGYAGGDFTGVSEALDENWFVDLGVNALWLSPTYANAQGAFLGRDGTTLYQGYHGYWPIDALAAEPQFGGDAALHEVISKAHAKGIRVVFDIVLNHVHEGHTYCSEQPDWCQTTCVCGEPGCDWNERALDCQFAPYLPDLSYRNHDILSRVVSDTMALAEKFDVDGLRIDAAKHMDHVVMRRLRLETDQIADRGGAPFYLVGETFTADRGELMNYIGKHELHGQFDFPIMFAARGAFGGANSFNNLEAAVADGERAYGAAADWMSPFIGNHDIPRFITIAARNGRGPFGNTPDLLGAGPADTVTQQNLVDRISLAHAFLLTQRGVPLIYYGDEVGLAGDGDPDNRRVMPRVLNANRLEILRRTQEAGKLRRELPALRGEFRRELWVDDTLYVYVRADDEQTAIVAMNKSETTRTENVTVPQALELQGATLRGVRGGSTPSVVNGVLRVSVEPWDWEVFVAD